MSKKRMLDAIPDTLHSDTERAWQAHEARTYHYRAQHAASTWAARGQDKFDSALKSFTSKGRRLRALRDGTATPRRARLDYFKVGYTMALQVGNLSLAILCIIIGLWPMALITTPGLLWLNYYFLLLDKG